MFCIIFWCSEHYGLACKFKKKKKDNTKEQQKIDRDYMDNAEGDFQQQDFHLAEGYCLNKRYDFPQRQFAIK